jgi:hypothetical protein
MSVARDATKRTEENASVVLAEHPARGAVFCRRGRDPDVDGDQAPGHRAGLQCCAPADRGRHHDACCPGYGGGSPSHVFGPVAGILRAVVVNGLVRERLRLIPHEQKREQLLTLTGLIEAGKLTPVLDRTYRLADTAEGLCRVEQGHARGKVVITVA